MQSAPHLGGLTAKLQIDPHMQPAAWVGTPKDLQLPQQAASIRGVSNGRHCLLALVQQGRDDKQRQLLHARSEPNSSVCGPAVGTRVSSHRAHRMGCSQLWQPA